MNAKMRSAFKLPPLGGRAMKYGYSNARVKAMKGLILKTAMLDEMVRVGNVEAMAELLQRTGYKGDVAAASVSYKGSELIEMAAARCFSKTAQKLVKIAPASDRDALKALLVRWDLLNIKTLLNARRLKRGYDEIRPYLFDVGGLDEDDFRRILKADHGFVLKEIMKTEVGQKMASVSDELGKSLKEADAGTGSRLEATIDSFAYVFMDKTLEQIGGKEATGIRNILKHEADAKNAMIIERQKRHGIQADNIRKSLIKGGTLSEQTINKLIEAKDIAATVKVLQQRFQNLELRGEGRRALTELEVALEKSIAIQKANAFQRSVLSVGVMFGFLLLKEEEVNNLRKIAKGKEFRMSESDVRAMLVVV